MYLKANLINDDLPNGSSKEEHTLGYIIEKDELPMTVACYMPGKVGITCLNEVKKRGKDLYRVKWEVILLSQEQFNELHKTGELKYGRLKVFLYRA